MPNEADDMPEAGSNPELDDEFNFEGYTDDDAPAGQADGDVDPAKGSDPVGPAPAAAAGDPPSADDWQAKYQALEQQSQGYAQQMQQLQAQFQQLQAASQPKPGVKPTETPAHDPRQAYLAQVEKQFGRPLDEKEKAANLQAYGLIEAALSAQLGGKSLSDVLNQSQSASEKLGTIEQQRQTEEARAKVLEQVNELRNHEMVGNEYFESVKPEYQAAAQEWHNSGGQMNPQAPQNIDAQGLFLMTLGRKALSERQATIKKTGQVKTQKQDRGRLSSQATGSAANGQPAKLSLDETMDSDDLVEHLLNRVA